jgi:hypothetical protein
MTFFRDDKNEFIYFANNDKFDYIYWLRKILAIDVAFAALLFIIFLKK